AWLGSAVVASNLTPYMITLHMLLALIIVALLIYVIARSQRDFIRQIDTRALPALFKNVLVAAMVMTLLQVAMGTQIREAIDAITNQQGHAGRQYWRDDFPIIFFVHRSFSSVILFTNLWLAWKLFRCIATDSVLYRFAFVLSGLVVAAILAGISLDRLGFPAVAQPAHLVLANLIFGAQVFIYICLRYSAENSEVSLAPR
ncbi:MAG: COX15/CtaA family protein, partial [Gammaproteobacteria bacterium]